MLAPLAFISMTESFGGHEVMLVRWLQEISRQAVVQPLLVGTETPKLRDLVAGSAVTTHFVVPRPRLVFGAPRGLAKLLVFAWLFAQFALIRLRTGARNAVVSEGALMSEPMATLAARCVFRRVHVYVPMVESFHALGYPDPDGATRRFMSIYRWVPSSWITLSEVHANIFRDWSSVRQPVHVLHNTIASGLEKAALRIRRAPAPDEVMTVLVLGRLSAHHKGLDLLLAHASANADRLRELRLRFLLVGDGEFKPDIEHALSISPALREVLELSPWCEPIKAYERADCVLLTSRIEGVPLVMLEAMALGIPCIATDLPGTRAYMSEESLYPVGDLSRAVQLIDQLRCPVSREQHVARHREQFQHLASAEAFAANVKTLTPLLVA